MNIDKFLNKYQIKLDRATKASCKSGIKIMKQGIDPHHNADHIYKILDHLDYLLSTVPNLTSNIKFNILLPAICWHDVWISKQKPRNILELLYQQIVEGRKSGKIWHLFSKDKLPNSQVKIIRYCIRKHSSFQLIPTFTLEAKILIDLDKLEIWNIYRFVKKKNTLVSQKKFYEKYIVRLYYRYSWQVGLYFKELNKKLDELRNKFLSEMKK